VRHATPLLEIVFDLQLEVIPTRKEAAAKFDQSSRKRATVSQNRSFMGMSLPQQQCNCLGGSSALELSQRLPPLHNNAQQAVAIGVW